MTSVAIGIRLLWIPAFAGMTLYGACRGAKPLCVLSCPPKIGGSRGLKEATVEMAFAANCKVRLLRLW